MGPDGVVGGGCLAFAVGMFALWLVGCAIAVWQAFQ